MKNPQFEKCEWIPFAIGAGLMAGSTIANGISTYNNNIANRSWQNKMNWANYNAQKEFAQNSIAWRKADAIRSGINPIYALGAQGANFSPSFAAGQDQALDFSGIGNIGQSLMSYAQARKEIKNAEKLQTQQTDTLKAQELLYTAQASRAIAETEQIQGKLGSNNSTTNKIVDSQSTTINTARPNFDIVKTGKNQILQTTENQQLQEGVNQGLFMPTYHTWLGSFSEADEIAAELNEKKTIKTKDGTLQLKDGEFAIVEFNEKYAKYGVKIYQITGVGQKLMKISKEANPFRLLQRALTGSWKSF